MSISEPQQPPEEGQRQSYENTTKYYGNVNPGATQCAVLQSSDFYSSIIIFRKASVIEGYMSL